MSLTRRSTPLVQSQFARFRAEVVEACEQRVLEAERSQRMETERARFQVEALKERAASLQSSVGRLIGDAERHAGAMERLAAAMVRDADLMPFGLIRCCCSVLDVERSMFAEEGGGFGTFRWFHHRRATWNLRNCCGFFFVKVAILVGRPLTESIVAFEEVDTCVCVWRPFSPNAIGSFSLIMNNWRRGSLVPLPSYAPDRAPTAAPRLDVVVALVRGDLESAH